MRKDTLAGATCIYRRKNIDRALSLSANRPLSTPMYVGRCTLVVILSGRNCVFVLIEMRCTHSCNFVITSRATERPGRRAGGGGADAGENGRAELKNTTTRFNLTDKKLAGV